MMRKVALLGSATLMTVAMASPAAAQFQAALDVSKQAIADGARSQQQIERLDDQAGELAGEYGAVLRRRDVLDRYVGSKRREVEGQNATIEGLSQDVENIEELTQAVTPLLEEMVGTLREFVQADMPFLMTERVNRLDRLDRIMADSGQSAAARYNLIMEAYQIENEYGRTIESYVGTVGEGEEELTVEFLRIGRLALIYKNADQTILRIFNNETGEFEDLDKSFMGDVVRGIRIANEQLPPDLMTIPVSAPTGTAGQ